MAVTVASAASELERAVLEAVKGAEARGEAPLACAMEVGRCVQESGMAIPSLELGEVLVSNLCLAPSPALWKLLDHSLSSRLLSPVHVLSLLTPRIIPHRRLQPEAYRLYLELVGRYMFSFSSASFVLYQERIIKAVDDSLQLSSTYGMQVLDIGQMTVLFVLFIITCLLDSVLEDMGLHFQPTDSKSALSVVDSSVMDIDLKESLDDKRTDRRDLLRKTNAVMALEVLEKVTANKKAKILLRLVHLNMSEKFNFLLQRLQLLDVHKTSSQILVSGSNFFTRICTNVQNAINRELRSKNGQLIDSLIRVSSCQLSGYHCSGAGPSACWIPLDVIMETSMDGRQLYCTSTVVMLTELTLNLQVINQASWQETFEALFVAALRLVQRDQEPVEGPVPGIDARLCVLLSITPLAAAAIIKEDVVAGFASTADKSRNMMSNSKLGMDGNLYGSRRHGLVSCLQQLGRFTSLLSPPPSVVNAANNAASKAASFLSTFKKGTGSFDGVNNGEISTKAVGSMLHLIVESCIARKLIDTSAYFWPGYVVTSSMPLMDPMSVQESPWSAFMAGAPLSGPLKNSLMKTPATSAAQVEKVYYIALNGSGEERSTAARILCGASLRQGWNVQEYVVRLVVKLLSPPPPPDFSGPGSHLFTYLPMINSVLYGASCIDVVHMISLFGLVPEVAAALMPLCEAFGSVTPTVISKGLANDESVYSVFSFAFLFLLRLWKFYRPPHEHNIAGRWGNVRPELTLDFILLMRKGSVASRNLAVLDGSGQSTAILGGLPEPIYVSSFPKLRDWYVQNQACIASTLSGVSSSSPVHQVANKILSMIYRKMSKVNPASSSSSSVSGSSMSTVEDSYQKPLIPAWEVLEAVPFVLDAILNACANGKLSSRELTTGLRDLVDFLPASLAIIISYFSSEITRGIWKPVPMNGIDWPSPAANLVSIETEIKEILASAGVHVPSCYAGGATPIIPLPMAALLSLTITFKLDNTLEYIHAVAGPALENCATGCSWSSMPIVGALWAQKVRRWHEFIVLSSARCPFTQDRNAVGQLLRSCFASFLGSSLTCGSQIATSRGVNGFIGSALSERGVRLPVAPGFLYLRSCRSFIDTRFLNKEVLKLAIEYAGKAASGWTCGGPVRLKYTQVSLASAATKAKEIAMLGSTLIAIAGGVRLVQILYMETLPTWLLSKSEDKSTSTVSTSFITEGYTLAYMMFLGGAFLWGVDDGVTGYIFSVKARRDRTISCHMDFIAGVMEGNISLGCHPVTWKAYVTCFLGLVMHFSPTWVLRVNVQTLRKVADGLRGWHEYQLALSLLEHGGPRAMSSVVQSIF